MSEINSTAQHSTTQERSAAPLTEILIIFKIEEEYWKAEANKLNSTENELHKTYSLTHSRTHSLALVCNKWWTSQKKYIISGKSATV
jgi:hypothetical protein